MREYSITKFKKEKPLTSIILQLNNRYQQLK